VARTLDWFLQLEVARRHAAPALVEQA